MVVWFGEKTDKGHGIKKQRMIKKSMGNAGKNQ
jgi:hypothetical protein